MACFATTAALEYVEKSGKIGVHINVRVLQRITNAGLRGQMHHWAELALRKNGLNRGSFGEIDLVEGKVVEFAQNRQPRLLQRRIVIIIDTVDADHRATGFKKPAGKSKSDEARGAGDEDRILRHKQRES